MHLVLPYYCSLQSGDKLKAATAVVCGATSDDMTDTRWFFFGIQLVPDAILHCNIACSIACNRCNKCKKKMDAVFIPRLFYVGSWWWWLTKKVGTRFAGSHEQKSLSLFLLEVTSRSPYGTVLYLSPECSQLSHIT
jgi:hypothetical protein